MHHHPLKPGLTVSLVLAGMLAIGVAHADKPNRDDNGQGGKHAQKEVKKSNHQGDDNRQTRVSLHFGDRQRTIVREYYAEQYRTGHCPPGLAKKNNGCMPPGQAKKWSRGRPLPADVVYYDLPPSMVIELGVPPAGHRYVRVATDILLIAIGTSMVVDAIEDLGRM